MHTTRATAHNLCCSLPLRPLLMSHHHPPPKPLGRGEKWCYLVPGDEIGLLQDLHCVMRARINLADEENLPRARCLCQFYGPCAVDTESGESHLPVATNLSSAAGLWRPAAGPPWECGRRASQLRAS